MELRIAAAVVWGKKKNLFVQLHSRQSTRDDADEKVIKGTDEEGTEAVGKPKNRVIGILVASIASTLTLCNSYSCQCHRPSCALSCVEDAVDEEKYAWKPTMNNHWLLRLWMVRRIGSIIINMIVCVCKHHLFLQFWWRADRRKIGWDGW